MKRLVSISLIILFIATLLTGCSRNTFQVRKNYQPRVKVDVSHPVQMAEEGIVTNNLTTQTFPVQQKTNLPQKPKHIKIKTTKETFLEKMAGVFIPKKKDLLRPVFHPEKKSFGTARTAGERTSGLVINLLALAFGIAAVLMVIGMVHGNVWVYFVVGLVLAAAAIIMGFIGKMMAWKAFGWLAGIIGILAVVLLLIFVLLITVVHVTF